MTEREKAYLEAACKVAWNVSQSEKKKYPGYIAFYPALFFKLNIPCFTSSPCLLNFNNIPLTDNFTNFRAAFMRWCEEQRGRGN